MGSIMVVTPLLLLAWLFPDAMLWLLGNKYESLRNECLLVVAASCIAQVSGVMWNLNSSKAWVRVYGMGFVPAILITQIVAALCLDLHQFHNVLIFNLVAAVAPLPVFSIFN